MKIRCPVCRRQTAVLSDRSGAGTFALDHHVIKGRGRAGIRIEMDCPAGGSEVRIKKPRRRR